MESRSIKVVVPDPVEPPRGAEWAAGAVFWIWQGLQRVARFLRRRWCALGQRRSARRAHHQVA